MPHCPIYHKSVVPTIIFVGCLTHHQVLRKGFIIIQKLQRLHHSRDAKNRSRKPSQTFSWRIISGPPPFIRHNLGHVRKGLALPPGSWGLTQVHSLGAPSGVSFKLFGVAKAHELENAATSATEATAVARREGIGMELWAPKKTWPGALSFV